MKKLSIGILWLCLLFTLPGQSQKLPLNFWFFNVIDTLPRHTSFKPLLIHREQLIHDSLPEEITEYLTFSHIKNRSFFARKLFFENLIQVDSADYGFTVDPLLNVAMGREQEDTSAANLYTNTRGFIIKGFVGKKLTFTSTFRENQSVFPSYISAMVDSLAVVPGQGRSKSFKDNGYDYAQATGSIAYQLSGNVLLQMGTDRFFIGNGYRSMLLSDAAHSYPYVGTTVYFFDKKIQYNAYYADVIHLQRRPYTNSPEALFFRKGMNFHYLAYQPAPWFEIGVFDNVMIEKMDSAGSKPFNFVSLNPVPFLPVLLFGWNGNNNASAGINAKLIVKQKTVVYGQFFYDGQKDNITQWAYQAGVKNFIVPRLGVGAEYNVANPFTYTASDAVQAYAHYQQPLANPLGGNFSEKVFWISFRYRRWFLLAKWNSINQNTAGSNVLSGNRMAVSNQKTDKNVYYANFGYIINPKTNLAMNIGVHQWNYRNNNLDNTSTYIYFGLKTNLTNIYYDF